MKTQGKHFDSNKGNNTKNNKRNIRKDNKKSFKNKILTLLIMLFLVLIVVSGAKLIRWYMYNRENQKIMDEIISENIVNEEGDELSIDFDALKAINSNVVGYIQVNNTDISYPVVQSSDNSYYLTHNFKNEYNSAGWIFMDYRNKLDGTDKNIIIYGHNMRDGSMFGSLKNILDSDWYQNEENKYITFVTEDGTIKYEVFSVYQVEVEDYYITTQFTDDTEYEEFLNTITNRSIYDFDVEVSSEDTILTLSTCASNNAYRIVLHAKKYNI